MLTPILLFLFVPFFIAVVMPNAIWLAISAAIMAAAIVVLWANSSFDGPMDFFGGLLLLSITIGAIAGVIARGIGLGLRSFSDRVIVTQSPVLAAFLLLAGGFSWLFVVKPQLDARPASQACLTSILHVSIGRSSFSTPPAPVLEISNGYKVDYALSRAKDTRSVCSATDNGSLALNASSLSLRFGDRTNHGNADPVARAFCYVMKPGSWAAQWCDEFHTHATRTDWPEKLVLGLSSDYWLRHAFLLNGTPREELAAGLVKSAGNGQPIVPQSMAGFIRYKMPSNTEYWVSTDPTWLLPDNENYMMQCSSDWCRVAFSIGGDLFAGYSFQTPIEGREARSRAVYSKTLSLLDELRAKP